MPELETRAEPDDRDRSASDPERGLTAAEVAERVARGQVNDVPAAPTRTVAQIVRGNIFTRFNAILGAHARDHPDRRAAPGRAVRVRADRERADRDRAGAAGQADAGPAHGAHRAEGAGASATAQVLEVAVGEVVLDDVLDVARRRPDRRRRRGARSAGPGGRRVAAHRRVRPRGEGARATRCCRARSWRPAPARYRATQGRHGGLRGAARAGARRFTLTSSELRSGIDTHPHRTSRSRSSPRRRCCSSSQLRAHDDVAGGGLGRRSPAPSRWCPRGSCC